jgi:hypothetical protein
MGQVRPKSRSKVAAAILGLALAATIFTVGSPAGATFPGTNGKIAYVQNGDVYVVNTVNPVPTQVTNTGIYDGVGYDATGNKLAASTNAGLVLLSPVAGSAVTPVPNTIGDDSDPNFNPTGTKLVFDSNQNLFTIDISGANREQIVSGNTLPFGFAEYAEWSADGTFIAFDDSVNIYRVNPSGGALILLSPDAECGPDCTSPTISPNNTKVAYTLSGTGIRQVNSDGTSNTSTELTTGDDDFASYSPVGDKIAFERSFAGNLSTAPTDGSGVTTQVDAIADVDDTSWGIATSGGTGTGTGTGTGSGGVTVNASFTGKKGKECTFTITTVPASATGVTVDYQAVNDGDKIKAEGNDALVPMTVTAKSKKKKRPITLELSDPKGATLGVAEVECPK